MKPGLALMALILMLPATARHAAAATPAAVSQLALSMTEAPGVWAVAVGSGPGAFGEGFVAPAHPIGTRLEARYRPRRRYAERPDYGPRPESFSQIHVGFMDPEGDASSGVLVGFRGGIEVDPRIQLGGNFDWRHKFDSATEVISEGVGPGGEVIVTRRDLSRSSSNFFPLLGFIQLSADRGRGVIPYAGLAGGYEVLFLSAENFQTGESFDGTFGGFGWQVWGGAALPLSGRARLNAEVFLNEAELSRHVEDGFTGQSSRETIDLDGAGMRFGLAWGF